MHKLTEHVLRNAMLVVMYVFSQTLPLSSISYRAMKNDDFVRVDCRHVQGKCKGIQN